MNHLDALAVLLLANHKAASRGNKSHFLPKHLPVALPSDGYLRQQDASHSSIVDLTSTSLPKPRSKSRQLDAILRKALSALLALYQVSNGACKPNRLSPDDMHIIGNGFQAALDPDFVSIKLCKSLVAEELCMGAISYSSLDVAVRCCSCRSTSYAGPVQLMKIFQEIDMRMGLYMTSFAPCFEHLKHLKLFFVLLTFSVCLQLSLVYSLAKLHKSLSLSLQDNQPSTLFQYA